MLVFDLESHLWSRFFPTFSAVGGHFALVALFFTISVLFTVAIAYLSRWYFEEPLLRLKRRFEEHGTQSLVTTALTYPRSA